MLLPSSEVIVYGLAAAFLVVSAIFVVLLEKHSRKGLDLRLKELDKQDRRSVRRAFRASETSLVEKRLRPSLRKYAREQCISFERSRKPSLIAMPLLVVAGCALVFAVRVVPGEIEPGDIVSAVFHCIILIGMVGLSYARERDDKKRAEKILADGKVAER